MNTVYDILIIGGGPAGYTAALYGARAGLSVLVLEKLSAGGQMALTAEIDNYPGIAPGADGFALGEVMQEAAEKYGAVTELAEVSALHLTAQAPQDASKAATTAAAASETVTSAASLSSGAPLKSAETSSGTFYGRAVILASGANPRKLGLAGEAELTGRGVHYCAACDGMAYQDKVVMVSGGGNSAVEDALQLSRLAKKVFLVHRRDTLRAEKIGQDALFAAPNVEFLKSSAVTALHPGENGRLKSVTLKILTSGVSSDVAVDGLFVSIGREPSSELAAGQLELDQSGYIIADETTRTSLPGVFAAGDVRTKALRQIVTAAADGAMAAHFAQEYLSEMHAAPG